MERRDWTLLLILAAIWGSSYLFIELGLEDLSAPMVVVLRIALGALVVVPYAWHRGALGRVRGSLGVLTLIAAMQVAAPFTLIAFGQEEITSSLAGILVASAPILTAILAIFFDAEERSEGPRAIGIVLGIGGVALLLGVDLGGSSAALLGGLAIVLASLGYAAGGLIVKRRLSGIDPLGISAMVLLLATPMAIPPAIASAPSELPGIGALAAVAALGMLGTGVAFVIFYGLIARVGPARAFIVTFLAPVFAIFYGALLLDEEITAATIGGMALILGGSWLAAEGRLPWRPRRVDEAPPEQRPVPPAPVG
jgi:drug/metabolite transporter (DMT)-like permease